MFGFLHDFHDDVIFGLWLLVALLVFKASVSIHIFEGENVGYKVIHGECFKKAWNIP